MARFPNMTRLGSRNPLSFLALLLILSPWSGGAVAGASQPPLESADDAVSEIRKVWTSLDERWNNRDAERFSTLFSREARFGFVNRGESLNGRGQILQYFSERFPTFAPEIRHRTTVQEIRPISHELAVLDGGVDILRLAADEGTGPTTILTFAIFAVMHRVEEGWKIRELRVVDLPVPERD